MSEEKYEALNFIEEIIEEDIKNGKHQGRIHTRFPPEPNGYLHIGHCKAISINFELAKKYGGMTNLRFDDTNPTTEDTEYVDAIKRDIEWLGYTWYDKAYFASDYFPQLYEFAEELIAKGLAYVDESTPEEIAEQKGVPTSPGKESPYRDRPKEESLRLFREMKAGNYPDGAMVLRAKVDMASPNMHMRDPILYRIKHVPHHRTGDSWCIYPMYDFAPGQSDSIENITHSLCSLEFRHHRPLYDWFIEKLEIFPSRQIEFARMNVAYMITSKRRLLKLVEDGVVSGWDDPRMPTISGMRRLGYPAAALRVFCDKVGVAKRDNLIEIELLESCVRNELNAISTRVMVVVDPLKVVITNFESDEHILLQAENNPEIPESGMHPLPFSKEIWIEREDFMVDAPKKYFRLTPGSSVRLKNAYIITATGYETDDSGNVTTVFAEYHPNSKSGEDTSGIKAKGTLHWASASHGIPVTLVEYDRLFTVAEPLGQEDKDFMEFVNKDSKHINSHAIAEPYIKEVKDGEHLQFLRKGYYFPESTAPLTFIRTVSLKDGWKPSN